MKNCLLREPWHRWLRGLRVSLLASLMLAPFGALNEGYAQDSGVAPQVTLSLEVSEAIAGQNIILTATVSELAAGVSVARVEFFDNDLYLGEGVLQTASMEWVFTLENISPGKHHFKARVVDDQGNSRFSPSRHLEVSWLELKLNFQEASSPEIPNYATDYGWPYQEDVIYFTTNKRSALIAG